MQVSPPASRAPSPIFSPSRSRGSAVAPCVVLLALLSALGLTAQAPRLPLSAELAWPGTEAYDPAVPTPERVIGHRVGTRHTEPAQVVRYFEAVAAASPRVTLREHGRTHEGRPLIHAVVTTPERQARLDDLAAAHRRALGLADPGEAGFGGSRPTAPPATPDGEAPGERPAVAYMGYSIHGDEASGTEAALLTLYHLAAGRGPAVDSVLERVVTVIDPMFNPDGRDRFVDWANRHRGGVANADPEDREHRQAWPRGRTNHYWFDLNRDWLPAQHPESRARLELYYHWRPQVLTDFHEMGSGATYFFQPGIPSRTNPLTPAANQALTGRITDYTARGLDRIGSLYYTRESFDDYYVGKGSTYPDVNGAVGILFEQASSRALEREVDDGARVLDYGFTVRNQTVGSLATLQAVAAMRDELLAHTREFYAAPSARPRAGQRAYAKTGDFAAYRIPVAGQRQRAAELAELLARHRVAVYADPAGNAYVVPTAQPQARFLVAAMEPNTTFGDSLFYDVSTWTLPLAYGLDVERVSRLPAGLGAPIDPTAEHEQPLSQARLRGDLGAAYAFAFTPDQYSATRSLYRVLAAGMPARRLHEPSTVLVDGAAVEMPRGTVVVPIAQSPTGAAAVRELARALVDEDGTDVYAVATGMTPSGPDLGGRSTEVLRLPKVALLTGDGTSAYQAGEVWHLLSERLGIPVTLLDVDRVGRADLSRYTHVAMTGGGYGGLDLAALKQWVQDGGTLLASHTAATFAVDKELVELEEAELDLDSLLVARGLPYAQLDEARGAQYVGGAALRVELDATHPLAYGIGGEVTMFRQHARFFRASGVPGATVGRYAADGPLASGYLSAERRAQAAGTAAVVEQGLGRGRVILFFDVPPFRAFWRGSERVWLNGLWR